MTRFVSVTHTVHAVRWMGEITPELQALVGGGEIEVKTSSPPFLVVANCVDTEGKRKLIPCGDWLYGTPGDVLWSSNDALFRAVYRPDVSAR